MVSLAALSFADTKVNDLITRLEKISQRAVTVNVENHHDLWSLRRMQYFVDAGDCVDAPKPQVAPSEASVCGFSSSISSSLETNTGSRGLIAYELDSPTHYHEPGIFLLIAWKVSMADGNLFAVDIIHENRKTFLRGKALDVGDFTEKRAVLDYLIDPSNGRAWFAGDETPILHVNPSNVKAHKRFVPGAPSSYPNSSPNPLNGTASTHDIPTPVSAEASPPTAATTVASTVTSPPNVTAPTNASTSPSTVLTKDPSFTLIATMTTTSVCKLNVFLYPTQKHDDEDSYPILSYDLMSLRDLAVAEGQQANLLSKEALRELKREQTHSGLMRQILSLGDHAMRVLHHAERPNLPPFIDGFEVFDKVNKTRHRLAEQSAFGLTVAIVNHTNTWQLFHTTTFIVDGSFLLHPDTKLPTEPLPLIENHKAKFGSIGLLPSSTKLNNNNHSIRGYTAYNFTTPKWQNLWPTTIIIGWEMNSIEASDGPGHFFDAGKSTNAFSVHVVEIRDNEWYNSEIKKKHIYDMLMDKDRKRKNHENYISHVGVAVVKSTSRNMVSKNKNCFSVYAAMSTHNIASLKIDVCDLQEKKDKSITPEVIAWTEGDLDNARQLVRSLQYPELHLYSMGSKITLGKYGLIISETHDYHDRRSLTK